MQHLISVIIPTLNEAERIAQIVRPLAALPAVETIVVDGGSTDKCAEIARQTGVQVLSAPRGRARQMNAGARAARGSLLLFLHGDTQLPAGFAEQVRGALGHADAAAGAFRLRIDSPGAGFRVIEAVANFRSRILQTPYGDQAIFVTRDRFFQLGGFPEMPVMEDFEFIRRARRLGRIVIVAGAAATSARRWEKLGLLWTTLLNWLIVLAYLAGVSPDRLAAWYGRQTAAGARAGSLQSRAGVDAS